MTTAQSPYVRPPAELIVFFGNDNFLELTLTDSVLGTAITGATVTAVFKDSDGTPIAGLNPITLTYVTAGLYRGLVPDDATLTEGDRVTVEITADDGANRKGFYVRKGVVHYA